MVYRRIVIATNNGDIGGGEVMLLRLASALRCLGFSPLVIGPAEPRDVLDAAERQGFEIAELPARSRLQYMIQLALWRVRNPRIPLWCNGLVPALASAFTPTRVVHLHSLPQGPQRAAVAIARLGADLTVVPSAFMARHVRNSAALANWTGDFPACPPAHGTTLTRIGFLGRYTSAKGLTDLADAFLSWNGADGPARLFLAGAPTFADPGDAAKIDSALARLGDRVTDLGWCEPSQFFSQIDLLVVPSRAPESFGLVVAEAMAAGVPVLVSDAGALTEVTAPGYPWVFPAGDADALARVLAAVSDDWGDHADSLSREGRVRWEREYSPEAGVARVHDLLRQLSPELRKRA